MSNIRITSGTASVELEMSAFGYRPDDLLEAVVGVLLAVNTEKSKWLAEKFSEIPRGGW